MANLTFTGRCPRCAGAARWRIRRRWWMRLVPRAKLYRCVECSARYLVVLGRMAIDVS